MITVEEAEQILRHKLQSWGTFDAAIDEPIFLRTAEALTADRAYPPVNRVTMDGIGLAWQTYMQGVRRFPILGTCSAGSAERILDDQNACFEVMTGCPLPLGADLVIPYEHLRIENDIAEVILDEERVPFQNVHRQGSDFLAGDCLLPAGALMHGPHWGIAASIGYKRLKCLKLPQVKIIPTGDELVDVDETPLPYQLRRSNPYALKASLLQYGFQKVDIEPMPDDAAVLRSHYDANKERYDLLIYSGGVSKGKFDYLPSVWQAAGVHNYIHGVSQRPGKPLWFGVDEKFRTAVLGLPGNPISVLVCLHRYFLATRPIYARLQREIFFDKSLTYFVPVKIEFTPDAILEAVPQLMKNSGEFSALANTDGFIELPKDQKHFKVGASFRFYPWTNIWRHP